MDLGIKDKRALVTGAGRGLGKSIASQLALAGSRVALVSRTEGEVRSLLDELGGKKAGHFGLSFDLFPEGAPAEFMSRLFREFGEPEIVVNNVGGTLEVTDPFCPIEDWQKVMRLNLGIAVEINRIAIPPMRKRRWGRVCHVSSVSSQENQGPVTYCAAKAALNAYARSLGRVVSADGVIVTSVLPGAVEAEGGYWERKKREKPEEYEKFRKDRLAIQRFGTPDEIGPLVAFLCSQHASFMVGSQVPVDGGQGRSFF